MATHARQVSKSVAGGAIAGALAAGMVLGGCTSDPEPVDTDIVAGTWTSPGGAVTTFDEGTWTVRGDEDPVFDAGTYTLDGSRLTMTTVYSDAFVVSGATCADGAVGVYEVSVADDGSSMDMTMVSDDCDMRAGQAGTQVKVD
jgi:hypothetical protein